MRILIAALLRAPLSLGVADLVMALVATLSLMFVIALAAVV